MTNLLPVFHKIEQNKKKLISNLFGSKKVELVKYGHKLLKLTTHPSRWKKKTYLRVHNFGRIGTHVPESDQNRLTTRPYPYLLCFTSKKKWKIESQKMVNYYRYKSIYMHNILYS